MSELGAFASYCEWADTFHHWPQSGILEVVDQNGEVIRSPGGSGEIVVTGFGNRITPLIRYRTGDLATLGEPCPHCHRPNIVLSSILGRVNDFLISARNRVVPLSALNYHGSEFQHIFAFQFVQEKPGHVIMRFVPRSDFKTENTESIARIVRNMLGQDFSLTIERVSSIPRTPRGKQPLIIQRCSVPSSDVIT